MLKREIFCFIPEVYFGVEKSDFFSPGSRRLGPTLAISRMQSEEKKIIQKLLAISALFTLLQVGIPH